MPSDEKEFSAAGKPLNGCELSLSYRLLPKGMPPKKIDLEIPGWAGERISARNGAVPQPWHCQPFIDGSTYGLELLYPFDTECRVVRGDAGIEFIADFTREIVPGMIWPPFRMANPEHYSLGTLLDLKAPPGFALRIEPHPRFFGDNTGTVPVPLIANLRTEWWPMYFFVTFKAPRQSETHVFRTGEPYAQVIVVPSDVSYSLREMSASEQAEREQQAQHLMRNRSQLARRFWTSKDELPFDDLYKQLKRREAVYGIEPRKNSPMDDSVESSPDS